MASAPSEPPPRSISVRGFVPIIVLASVWGCNWPALKMGVAEIAPLTFRSITLPLAALGMLGFA